MGTEGYTKQCHSIKRLGISALAKEKTKEFETLPEVKHFTSKQFPMKNTLERKETVQFK